MISHCCLEEKTNTTTATNMLLNVSYKICSDDFNLSSPSYALTLTNCPKVDFLAPFSFHECNTMYATLLVICYLGNFLVRDKNLQWSKAFEPVNTDR